MWEKCKELQEELVRMRRELHQIPELGGELPKLLLAGSQVGGRQVRLRK